MRGMKDRPIFTAGSVREVSTPAPSYADLLLEAPEVARRAQPGQFVMIRGWPGMDPYLPRPFDIVEADPDTGVLRLFVKVEGRGTGLLGRLQPGQEVRLAGPVGRAITSFPFSSMALLLRGAGAAAVVMLARRARTEGVRVHTFLSASTAGRVVCREFLEPLSTTLEVATDDGSAGYHGNATDLLDRLLEERTVERVYTCGARRFARHVKELHRQGRTEGYVFLEGLMACGLGDCHGCAVARDGEPGYYLVCQDGPHFRLDRVVIE